VQPAAIGRKHKRIPARVFLSVEQPWNDHCGSSGRPYCPSLRGTAVSLEGNREYGLSTRELSEKALVRQIDYVARTSKSTVRRFFKQMEPDAAALKHAK
jgi:hypothetical protein